MLFEFCCASAPRHGPYYAFGNHDPFSCYIINVAIFRESSIQHRNIYLSPKAIHDRYENFRLFCVGILTVFARILSNSGLYPLTAVLFTLQPPLARLEKFCPLVKSR